MANDDDDDKKPEEEEEDDEEDLEKLQAEIDRMEAEAAKIAKQTEELEKKKQEKTGEAKEPTPEEQAAKDSCSVYVGQVDYSATPEDLVGHFKSCGTVERVTIVCDKYTGQPKGFAYIEFNNETAVQNAVKLDGSELKGRTLKVTPKRVNIPGFNRGGGGGGGGGRGRGRGGPPGRGEFRGGRGPPGRGYRGGFRGRGGGRGRGRGGFHPY